MRDNCILKTFGLHVLEHMEAGNSLAVRIIKDDEKCLIFTHKISKRLDMGVVHMAHGFVFIGTYAVINTAWL